ncbi:SGNH/GDSL hydrolase family protein [Lyngbya sp. CCAP 1446/10]|uniref:SGNH/GDSL hydrolase family protein n=1 Tax=Lyngbya sp. CCAP 1446/10 TaxID=439293 RepID=UPI002238D93B|nr:GDSL-type esterase/lipase family protein [Lyngbya sp. CCAP 1446/10]MCW6049921.1 SGNH/GDSL hydrolase family protein [Lyngbya sp. CCAP 1446/10]
MKFKFRLISTVLALLLSAYIPFRGLANPQPSGDTVSSALWWQASVYNQVQQIKEQKYEGCVWGDSISSALGDSLGEKNFNFAIGGMSSVSLLEQLKLVVPQGFTCEKSILAIGTNDAMYGISDEQFVSNLKEAIAIMRSLGTKKIILIPAFYSTLAASYNPKSAGTIARVDEINVLIDQVATAENLTVESSGIQALFKEKALNGDLTKDGVHLNAKGLDIYRKVLLNILNSSSVTRTSF